MTRALDAARRLGLGAVARKAYKEPLAALRQSIVEGGPIQQSITSAGKAAMIRAAEHLPPLSQRANGQARSIYFLTGANYWYQTVYCIYSLELASPYSYSPVIIDDGSLSRNYFEKIAAVIPWVTVRSQPEILDTLDRVVPEQRYPALHSWRKRQPLTRKIVDLHAGQHGWKLLLDSDMLFFRRPDWLEEWFENPKPAYMVDCIENYGYTAGLRAEVCGKSDFPSKANIGFFGWKSEEVDFDWLEFALRTLMEREGPKYNITQGLTSMMFAGRLCSIAPEKDYVVLPSLAEGRRPQAVLHHYVAHSKRSYFQYGWREIDRRARADAAKPARNGAQPSS
jgi:hypothetical protein